MATAWLDQADPRVRAVLEVLRGSSVPEVAARWSVEPALVRRWVRGFVDAGSARVTNRPDPEASRERDRFLAAFAHELRTPLTTAQGWAAMLGEGDVPPAAAARTVARLESALVRLGERVTDVELLAAASLGLVRLDRSRVSLGELAATLPGVDEVHGLGPEVVLDVDPDLFRRVLRDLWLAAGSRPEPRARRLAVAEAGPWWEITVVRDADPIDPAVLTALFEPFELNDDGTGVTIGLYLARALVVAHGGTLGADQDDDGAVLWVRVPRGVDPARPTPEEIHVQARLR
ncbi:MAG TPA: histidine kinase dimerization/phospho-acceptor domain-containing protein [Nocardioides sp.]|nr:histidine kinase dimerization/phospho-acceptor domain-containing protein [Nocardioides sp.]